MAVDRQEAAELIKHALICAQPFFLNFSLEIFKYCVMGQSFVRLNVRNVKRFEKTKPKWEKRERSVSSKCILDLYDK